MQIEKEEIKRGFLIRVKEPRIDMSISRAFRDQIEEILKEKPAVTVIDLEEVEYLDSSALGTLVSILKTSKANGGEIRLANLSQSLRSLMKLSKLEAMFKIFDSVDEAVA